MSIKRIICFIIVTVMTITMIPQSAFAESQNDIVTSGTCGENLQWELDTNGVLKITGEGKMNDYQETEDDFWKTSEWAIYNEQIKEVIIEEGVTSVGNYAFYRCWYLEKVQFPESLEVIGDYCFADTPIEILTLPKKLITIGDSAFKDCKSIVRILIPDAVTTLGESSFAGCDMLEHIVLGDGVSTIQDYTFFCLANINEIYIPKHVKSISENAFNECYDFVIYGEKGSYAEEYASNNSISFSSETMPTHITECLVNDIPMQVYGVDDMKPEITLLNNDNILIKNIDYKVIYEQGYILITGIGEYSGTMEIFYDIQYPNIKDAENLNITQWEYIYKTLSMSFDTNFNSEESPDAEEILMYMAFNGELSKYNFKFSFKELCNLVEKYLCNYNQKALRAHLNQRVEYGYAEYDEKADVYTLYVGYGGPFKCVLNSLEKINNTYYLRGKFYAAETYIKDEDFAITKTKDGYKIEEYNEHIHRIVVESGFDATCTNPGKTEKKYCNLCGEVLESQREISAKGHSYSSEYTVDKKATYSANGSKSRHCTRIGCSSKTSVTTIPKISSVTVSTSKFTYDGYNHLPAITVKDANGNTLKKGTDYTTSYPSSRWNVGRYKITVTMKGNYSGTFYRYYTIVPKAATNTKANLYGYDDVKATWTKAKGASGYYVYYKKSTSNSYTYYSRTTGTSMKIANLTDGVKYNFKVMPYYYSSANDTRYTSLQSSVASVYTLKQLPTPTVTRNGSKVKVKWTNINGESGYQISRSTSKTGTNIVLTNTYTTGTYNNVSATKGKGYYYKVRAYKTVNGTKIYAPWSSVKYFKR